MSIIIDAAGLTKSFGSHTALANLDLRVESGEVHGFLGPNGAGKSTTLKILLGLLRTDSGTAQILGMDSWTQSVEIHGSIGFVPGDVNLWPNLSGGEAIDLIARMRGREDATLRAELIDRFDLDPRKKCRTYSTGNRRKVVLIAALSSAAPLLLLDEPTAGLDPLMEAEFQAVIRTLRAEGTTVLLSSHILSEVEHLADRISVIRSGTIVETGTLESMRHLSSTHIEARTLRRPSGLAQVPGVSNLQMDGTDLSFDVAGEHLDEAMQLISDAGLVSLGSRPPSLEELLLGFYERAESPS